MHNVVLRTVVIAAFAFLRAWSSAQAHTGPDPIAHWYFTPATVRDGQVAARLGPNAKVVGAPQLAEDALGTALRLDGVNDYLLVAPTAGQASEALPRKHLTIAVWATVEATQPHGALISTLEKDGEGEKGWLLGYDDRVFRFALSALGADDGNGRATTIRGTTQIAPGRYYHVVATYDGQEMRLYVDGRLEAQSRQQEGPVYQSRYASYALGAAVDHDERHVHRGLIRDAAIYDLAATDKWVEHEFDHFRQLTTAEPQSPRDELQFVVTPYLQFVTQNQITVMCETSRPAAVTVRYGETGQLGREQSGPGDATLHEITLAGLAPETAYYYQVEAVDDRGRAIRSPLLSLQTANRQQTPFAFGVMADMQYNPRVCKILSDMLWMQRPNFVIVPGDLVDRGPVKEQWTEHFFPGMQPLISRVAFFPVLGNHEENAGHYYRYMALPQPEYYYTFCYGNAQFFMIDSNKKVDPASEQYLWLEAALAESTATWKFVSYHHPSYSSDEDDYGDMWTGERSEYGDLRLRPLSTLYDRYGVDIVWNGHIHSYERTWPLREGKAVESNGTIYMITGGAGGNLETAGPIKPWFQNNVKHGHHYCLVCVNGRTLEFKAFDMEGRLFDFLRIDKATAGADRPRPTTAEE